MTNLDNFISNLKVYDGTNHSQISKVELNKENQLKLKETYCVGGDFLKLSIQMACF